MTTLRFSRFTAFANSTLRLAKFTATGTTSTPKLRISRLAATGALPVSLQPIANQTAEPFATVTLTAVPGATSPTPDSYHWRQVPNGAPTVSFQDGGSTITFTVPPTMTGTPVIFGVVANLGTQASAEVTGTVTPPPHLYWAATSTGWAALNAPAQM